MADTKLHPILAKRGIPAGTPEAVLKVAEYFVAMKYEEGPNKDNIFGRWYGANHTHWCAEFVSYCFSKAGAAHVVANTQQKHGYISCTQGIKGMKKKGMKVVTAAEAQAGDIVFFDWDADHDPDHTGIVVSNNPKKKTMVCREGNTSRGDGSRSNGGQVAQRTRSYSNIFIVFRPDWKMPSVADVQAVATKAKDAPKVAPKAKVAPKPEVKAVTKTAPKTKNAVIAE
jgi:hypothetical protein